MNIARDHHNQRVSDFKWPNKLQRRVCNRIGLEGVRNVLSRITKSVTGGFSVLVRKLFKRKLCDRSEGEKEHSGHIGHGFIVIALSH